MNAIDKPPKLKIEFVSTRDLVPSDRATCMTASRANFFITNLRERFDVLVLSVSSYIYELAPDVINTVHRQPIGFLPA